MSKSRPFRQLALVLPVLCLASAASAATVPTAQSRNPASPVRLDGKADDWAGVPRVSDVKAGAEFAFQNGARNETVYEFRLPLASAELVPGGIGGAPGSSLRVSFEWGGRARKSLSTESGSKSSGSTGSSSYQSGTGRTWGQEYLDNYDPMSRPNLDTRRFSFAVDVKLADAL